MLKLEQLKNNRIFLVQVPCQMFSGGENREVQRDGPAAVTGDESHKRPLSLTSTMSRVGRRGD